jgi:hypothetical protein
VRFVAGVFGFSFEVLSKLDQVYLPEARSLARLPYPKITLMGDVPSRMGTLRCCASRF